MTGAGLLYIGLDDMFVLHERIGFVLNNWFGTGGFYGESFNWLFYFAPFMCCALYFFYRIIMLLWHESRTAAIWMLAGVGLWLAAIGTEIIGRSMIVSQTVNVPIYHALIVLEELLEFVGATGITCALWIATRTLVARTIQINSVEDKTTLHE